MDKSIITECKMLSLEGKITFPEVIKRLSATGVERYTCDLVGLKTYYYSIDNLTFTLDMPIDLPEVSRIFDGASIKHALNEIQQGKSIYPDFLKTIAVAGCSHYEVYFNGKKALYFGRAGSHYIEYFPLPKL